MSSKKKIFIKLLVTILILYFILLFIVDVLNSFKVYGRMLFCENYLKVIAKAINLYQADFDRQWPESLEAMKQYYDPPNRIPTCPGNRNEQETSSRWVYYYFKPKVGEVVPVCWDSNPHYNTKKCLGSPMKLWNVLYSDGHIESLSERGLFRELFRLAKTNHDVLKVLKLPADKKYGNLPIFLVGILIGLSLVIFLRKKKINKAE